ncbi:MAG: DUF6879 family protein [Egibacteraceae bacterium]
MGRRIVSSSDEFSELFTSFEHTAYRLESLQRYTVPYEEEPLRRFLAGESHQVDPDKEWFKLIRDAVNAGKRMERVHVVVEPHSDYMRFELTAYADSVVAGEDIRIIPIQPGEWPPDLPGHGYDYWLFDSRTLAVMHYDHEGRLVAVDLVDDPGQVVQANFWRDVAWHLAIPYREYKTDTSDVPATA